MSNETTLTPKEMATQAGTSDKRMRAHLRANGYFVGQGNRHGIAIADAKALIESFGVKRASSHAPARSAEEVAALLAIDESDES